MNIEKSMKAIILKAHGDYKNLEFVKNYSVPQVKENEVLIEVKAAGVNNTDINTRIGWYSKNESDNDASWSGKSLKFPRIQGADVCGVIVKVGENVDISRVGQRVLIEPSLQKINGKQLKNPWYFELFTIYLL